MERIRIDPRPDWKARVEPLGMVFHTTDGEPYWSETAYYRFTEREILEIEAATNELHRLCLEAGQHIIDNNRFAEMGIPLHAVPTIRDAWDREPPSIYGRFDLAYSGNGPPKLLEYNADTPTTLLEAAVVQWFWLQDRFPNADQFNSIWEGLVEKWTELHTGNYLSGSPVYFAHVESTEDLMTVTTLRDTAEKAGIATVGIHVKDIGWDGHLQAFVDLDGNPIRCIFKLYPWEWMLAEPFGTYALQLLDRMQWIEPIWKLMWSNKGILPILWKLFPDHPNLLEACFGQPADLQYFVRKPLFSREGHNITIHSPAGVIETEGRYGDGMFICQALADAPVYDGNHPIIGSWVIDGTARGMGIREADGPVTDNYSRFVPHLFTP